MEYEEVFEMKVIPMTELSLFREPNEEKQRAASTVLEGIKTMRTNEEELTGPRSAPWDVKVQHTNTHEAPKEGSQEM
jgi:hypothetical protein